MHVPTRQNCPLNVLRYASLQLDDLELSLLHDHYDHLGEERKAREGRKEKFREVEKRWITLIIISKILIQYWKRWTLPTSFLQMGKRTKRAIMCGLNRLILIFLGIQLERYDEDFRALVTWAWIRIHIDSRTLQSPAASAGAALPRMIRDSR
jgi:hypothetical protein